MPDDKFILVRKPRDYKQTDKFPKIRFRKMKPPRGPKSTRREGEVNET